MKISVIIPTFNHRELLLTCLDAVLRQTRRPDEVIVADNGSTDGTAAAVRARFENAVLVCSEKRAGVDAARNRGVVEASGEVLLFTDDDILPQPSWVEKLGACFEDPQVRAAGGPVFPLWPERPSTLLNDSARARSLLGNLYYGPKAFTLDAGSHFLVGGNLACRREFVLSSGFRGLWKFAGAGVCGEDYELSRRLAREGKVLYEPAAYVFHRIAPDKMRLGHLMKRAFYFEAANTKLGSRLKPKRRLSQLLGAEGLISASVALGHVYGRLRGSAGTLPS